MRRGSFLLVLLCCLGLASCRRPPVNVLLVTFDTTRWDHVGYASGRDGLTPTLDALAKSGTWFETATVSAPITLPSHATILSGLEPYRHGVRNNGTYILPKSTTTIAECLADRGYRTHAVVSAFVLDSRFGLDQGFDHYDDDFSGAPKNSIFMSREISAEQTASKAISWLNESERENGPFFLWTHFFDPHASYDPPPEYLAPAAGDPYQAEIIYADAMLGRVIAEFERLQILDNTLVVFLSDHGESLGEHGERTHGIFIYDATMRVPLLLAGPGVAPGHRVRALVRSIDVMPTILDLVGAPVPSGLDGTSLRRVMADSDRTSSAYMESLMPRLNYGWSELRGLRTETHKVILAPRIERYNLDLDPGELTNLNASSEGPQADVHGLLDELKRLKAMDPFSLGGHEESDVGPETREALEVLGYTRTDTRSASPGSADPKDRVAEFETLRSARALIDEDSLTQAREILTKLVSTSPANMDALLALAHVHVELGDVQRALSVYEQTLDVDPNHPQAVRSTAHLLVSLGEIDRAERLLIDSQSANPDFLDLQIELCLLFQATNRPEDAEACYRQAHTIDPSAPAAVLGLVNCLEERGNEESARDLLENAFENNVHDPELVERLAGLYGAHGEHEKSTELYLELARLEPDNPSAWNNLAAQLARLNRYPEAADAAQRAYDLEPDILEIRANLGTMLALAGQLEAGVAHLNVAVPLMPANTYGASVRAQALEYLGRHDQALAAWSDLAARDPAAGIHVARIQLRDHDVQAALKTLAESIDRGGNPIRTLAENDPELRPLAAQIP